MLCISYCGIKCNECEVFDATVNNDNAKRIRLAKEYSTEQCNLTKDDINCKGCHSIMLRRSKMCSGCEIRNCAKDKDIFTCAECNSYPCCLIEKHVPLDSENRKTLDKLREINIQTV